MAAHDAVRWHPPLKAPAVEIIDLLSDSELIDTPPESGVHNERHDAYGTISRAQERGDGNAQWRESLQAPVVEFNELPSRDVSAGLGEELVNGDDAKARDASSAGSDGDEDDQWSLYEDALDEDEDGLILQSSMEAVNPNV